MDKKEAHTKAGSQDNQKFKDNSANNQRLKLLDYMFEHGSITTQKAREALDIYFPPARIKELRQAGYLIETVREHWVSEYGITHSIGRYVLMQKQPVDAN
jgi:membrane carboxypeptidase/penicillin-binding protein